MRSGIVHLKKRMDDERQENSMAAPEAIFENARSDDVVPDVSSRLDKTCWSVISFDKLEAGGLTYAQAEQLMAALDTQDVAGLCIVTDEAAARTAG